MNWEIQNLFYTVGPDSHGHNSIVYAVQWKLTMSDEEDLIHYKADWSGNTTLEWTEGDDWIEFGDLSEDDVIGWIEQDIDENELDDIEAILASRIEQDKNPIEASVGEGDLPWIEPEEEMEDDSEEG